MHIKTVTRKIGLARSRSAVAPLLGALVALALAVFANLSRGEEPAPVVEPPPVVTPAKPAPDAETEQARKNFKLPGLVINFQQRCVDLDGSICLDQGMLELVACTKGTKEHESIVAITARPMHIHTALLLLGANSGNPAMRKAIDEQGTRWIHIPPRGDLVNVFLVFENDEGAMVEHPISKFIARSDKRPDELYAEEDDTDDVDADKQIEFPHTFLFAGSLLRGDGPGPRKYLSDLSGNVISIATFGDEVLCLPGVHGLANDLLMWQVNATELPKVGTQVTLRLRPQVNPDPKAGKAEAVETGREQ
jgi:hypothetical protein